MQAIHLVYTYGENKKIRHIIIHLVLKVSDLISKFKYEMNMTKIIFEFKK